MGKIIRKLGRNRYASPYFLLDDDFSKIGSYDNNFFFDQNDIQRK